MLFRNDHPNSDDTSPVDFPTLGIYGVRKGDTFQVTGDAAQNLLKHHADQFPRVDRAEQTDDTSSEEQ